jgi:hypothetical protein
MPFILPRNPQKRLLYLILDAKKKAADSAKKVIQGVIAGGSSQEMAPQPPGTFVESICKSGETPLKGDVTLSESAGISITQSGQDIAFAASVALDDITDVNAPSPDDDDVLMFDSGTGTWIAAPASSASDQLVKCSTDDPTSQYLEDKLIAGNTGIIITNVPESPTGDEQLRIFNVIERDDVNDKLTLVIAGDDIELGNTEKLLGENASHGLKVSLKKTGDTYNSYELDTDGTQTYGNGTDAPILTLTPTVYEGGTGYLDLVNGSFKTTGPSGDDAFCFFANLSGDSVQRLYLATNGIAFGDGTNTPDVSLVRGAANRWDLGQSDCLKLPSGNIRLGDFGVPDADAGEAIIWADAAPNGGASTLAYMGDDDVAHYMSETWQMAYKSADETIQSDTTISNDAALTKALAASSKYAFRARIFFDTTANADFKYQLTYSGTNSIWRCLRGQIVPGTAASTDTMTEGVDLAPLLLAASITGAGTTGGFIQLDGVIHTGNAGTWAFAWAQNTSDAANTTVRAGSYVEFFKVA